MHSTVDFPNRQYSRSSFAYPRGALNRPRSLQTHLSTFQPASENDEKRDPPPFRVHVALVLCVVLLLRKQISPRIVIVAVISGKMSTEIEERKIYRKENTVVPVEVEPLLLIVFIGHWGANPEPNVPSPP